MINQKTTTEPGTQTSRRLARPSLTGSLRTLLPVGAVGLGYVAIRQAHLSAIGPYGLSQALPPLYYVALTLAGLSFVLNWSAPRASALRLSADLVALVLLLQSPPALIEPDARFSSAWLIAGFADYVARTGHVLPNLDARFSWPGFFAGIGTVARAAGLPDTIVLLKWWPVALNLLYLPPLYFLTRAIVRTHRGAALATWLFPLANWVGQDYFSPQSVAFLLYLVFMWLVVEYFGARRSSLLPSPVQRWVPSALQNLPTKLGLRPPARTGPGQPQAQTYGGGAQPRVELGAGLGLSLLATLGCATIVSHQITPIFAGLAVTLLAILGRTSLKLLGTAILLLTAGWICYSAIAFWSGHFNMLAGGLGDLSANVTSDLSQRLRGSPQHYQILDVRLGVSSLVWVLALAGFWVGYRRRLEIRTPAILMITPFLVLSGGGYGGEAGLRVYLFSLAGALPLITMLFPLARSVRSAVAAGLISAILVPGWVLARWGNELSEMTRPGDLAAVRAVYRIAPAGATLISITPQVSWDFTDITKYKYEPDNLDEFAFAKVGSILAEIHGNPRSGYVIVTTSQLVYGEQTYGLPMNWGARVEAAMIRSGQFVLVYANHDAKIYEYRGHDADH